MKLEIDGKEVELEGIEADSLVIARPTKQLDKDAMKKFADGVQRLSTSFKHYGITVISANKDTVTFEVLKAVNHVAQENPTSQSPICNCGGNGTPRHTKPYDIMVWVCERCGYCI